MNKAFMFDKNKNLYSIKIRLNPIKRSFIALYRILQAYSNKIFCWFSLLKHPNAKDDWASSADVGEEFGSHSVSLIIGILQSLISNAFPIGMNAWVV
ncbi:hypothetical protein C2R96_01390 [Helicobacter pylori]|nr:hypothetical protein C2R96_01390 [Helicobacter pylori]